MRKCQSISENLQRFSSMMFHPNTKKCSMQIRMNKFGLKDNVTDKDFMIHVLNNLPKEYDVIPDGLENCLMASGNDVLTINMIHKNLNHQYKKIKSKKEEKREKEKALRAYNKQCKQRCHKCGKFIHKPGNHKCPEYKKGNEREKNDDKNEKNGWSMLSLWEKSAYELGLQRKEIQQ